MRYNNQTIVTMVKQLQTWYIITNKEKLDVEALFHETCSNTPMSHSTTFACELERRQAKCEDNLVIITNVDKVDHFVAQMYLSDIFESKFLEDWEDGTNKDWVSTKILFVAQYNKEQHKINRTSTRTPYDSSAVLRETPVAPYGAPLSSDRAAYYTAIERAQDLEEQRTRDAAEILRHLLRFLVCVFRRLRLCCLRVEWFLGG